MVRGCSLIVAMLVGCSYAPHRERACEVECDPTAPAETSCPQGLSCFSSATGGICKTPSGDCGDVPIDARDGDPGIDASLCVGKGLVSYCFTADDGSELSLPAMIDTDGVICDATEPAYCRIAASRVNVESLVRATGSRPLVVVALHVLQVKPGATLDVASRQASPGAGRDTSCAPSNASGAVGGTGGSNHGLGGIGGVPSGSNGTQPQPIRPPALIGGCDGGYGGTDGGTALATPGRGGGAVYVAAGETIIISGTINASGAGAYGGNNGAGSGGGAGGLIGLDAPMISLGATAILVANGGGGSSGKLTPDPGGDPNPATPTIPAAGATSISRGGDGSVTTILDGKPAPGPGNGTCAGTTCGGGGGGAAGYILVYPADQVPAVTNMNRVSPNPTSP